MTGKANIGDLVMAESMKMVNQISDHIAKEYAGVKPFDSKYVPPKDRLFEYDSMKPQDMLAYVQKNGTDAAEKYIFEMEELRKKLGKGAER